jgi:nucleoid-associated protein YgaU
MRKDVKFGLTIGAILVVTLVVYVIVLSRGPAVPPKIGLAMPSPTDRAPDPTDSTPMPSGSPHNDVAENTPGDQATIPGTDASNTPAPAPNTDAALPATQPASGADVKSTDWDKALNNGMPPSLSAPAAPEHTVTPTIDLQPFNSSREAVSRTPNTPVIDTLPTTQPSSQFVATSLYATDPTPPAMVQPVPAAPAPGPRTHRVASGESPYSIAQSVYGNARYYKRILAANPRIDPRHLKIGQILVIPELSETDKNPPSATSAGETHVDSATMYTVVSGDSLESISVKLYGSATMIDRLYTANKSLIGPDENVLKIGWVLKLPQAPTVASAQR